MSNELKPCGHCGHRRPDTIKTSDKLHPYMVRCGHCGIQTAHHGDAQAAINAWNTRA